MNAASRGTGPLPRPTPPSFVNSGRFTPLLIAVLCLVLVGVAWERGRGNYHRIRTAVLRDEPPSGATGFGGQEPIRLVRTPDALEGEPEFLSATLLPGRGLNVLQITASIPGHGEVPLLASPALPEAAAMLSGSGADANGALSSTIGGAFMMPWAGRLSGRPSDTPGVLQTVWVGQRLTFPAATPGSLRSTTGLLLDRGADTAKADVILGGQSVDATFHPGTFSGNWPATGSVHIEAAMTGHIIDLTVSVQNTGDAPMPVGIGWLPHFSVAGGDRRHAQLVVPSTERLETDRSTGLPTGATVSVAGTALDLSSDRGSGLPAAGLDETYAHLLSGPGTRSSAELRDTDFGYGLRLTPMSPSIRALHVVAPADKPWVAIAPETNYDDALGGEWTAAGGSGIRTLQPGESLQWKVRLELFSLKARP